MKYFLYLMLAIPFKILAKLLSPVLPLFARNQYGYGATEHGMAVEPRLPIWLDWFMMDDHSLWGGEEWRTKLHPHNYKTHWGMTLWLLRNSACNFGRYPLAVIPGDPKAWQSRKVFPIIKKYSIHTNFGWNLDSPGRISGLCGYVFSIKVVENKNGT
jgi:hypothetical protein